MGACKCALVFAFWVMFGYVGMCLHTCVAMLCHVSLATSEPQLEGQ